MGAMEIPPPNYAVIFIPPTPANNATIGFNAPPTITISYYNATTATLEYNGVNYSLGASPASWTAPNLTAMTSVSFVARIQTMTGYTNQTERRIIIVSGMTQGELDSRLTAEDFITIGLVIIIILFFYFLLRM
jgi:hypothetical protein